MTALRLVRHGEVAAPHRGSFYGQLDVPLSPEGLAGSLRLAAELARDAPDCVYTSPLSRARALAQAAAEGCGAPLVVEPAFAELDRGLWTGRARTAIEAETPGAVAAYVADPEGGSAPGGERESELSARVWGAVDALANRQAGRRVLLVAHAHVLRVLMARVAGWSPAESMQHFLPLLGVADLELTGGAWRIVSAPEPLDQERVLRPQG
ncbi:MAG TPA: histidine phosphatase family protein [Planctomycetota bacterium]|nr:histidine phosphatase family protein [Planctomycetota bacterium]